MQNFKRGFTLIELLVVVGIIGILASVTLVALTDARNRGVDASVKSNLSNAVKEAEFFYEFGATYDAVCATSGTNVIGPFVVAAQKAYNGSSIFRTDAQSSLWNTGACHDSLNSWAATVPLKSSASGAIKAWCVDSTGVAKQITSALASGAYVCP